MAGSRQGSPSSRASRRGLAGIAALGVAAFVFAGCVKPAPPPPPPSGHLTASPASIDLGTIAAGTGATTPLTITNDGEAGIVVPVYSVTGPVTGAISVGNLTCFSGLSPGASCQLTVAVPVIGGPPPGQYSATITIDKPPGDLNPQTPVIVPVSVTVT